MKKALLLLAALALAGCKTTGPHPGTPGEDGSPPGGPVPTAPPLQVIPDTGMVPPVPGATRNIVTMYCPDTGQYTGAGVDTEARRFTFVISGGRATQQAAFARFYEAGVPVTVYTSPVRLKTRGTPAPAPMTAPPAPAPTPSEGPPEEGPKPPDEGEGDPGDSDDDGDGSIGPCINISDKPPTIPTGPGGKDPYEDFLDVVWSTAFALDGVIEKVGPLTAPGAAPVPR